MARRTPQLSSSALHACSPQAGSLDSADTARLREAAPLDSLWRWPEPRSGRGCRRFTSPRSGMGAAGIGRQRRSSALLRLGEGVRLLVGEHERRHSHLDVEVERYGIPIVATAVGGVPEIVTSQAGVLVGAGASVPEIAAAVKDAITPGRFAADQIRGAFADRFDAPPTTVPSLTTFLRSGPERPASAHLHDWGARTTAHGSDDARGYRHHSALQLGGHAFAVRGDHCTGTRERNGTRRRRGQREPRRQRRGP